MGAVINISLPDEQVALLEQIRSLVTNIGKGEISIRFKKPKKSTLFRKETKEEYWERIRQAGEEIKQGKGRVFTMEELREFINKMPEE